MTATVSGKSNQSRWGSSLFVEIFLDFSMNKFFFFKGKETRPSKLNPLHSLSDHRHPTEKVIYLFLLSSNVINFLLSQKNSF